LPPTTSTTRPELDRGLRRLVVLAGVVVLVDTLFFAAITPLLPEYADSLHLSKAAAGVLSAAYPVGAVLGSLPAGWLAARWGVRPTVLAGLLMVAASSIAFGFAHDVVLLDLARFWQGIGGAALWAGGFGWLMAAAPRERRGELIGAALGAAIFGTLLGPALGAAASLAGTGPVFTVVALVAAALGLAVLRTPAPGPTGENDAGALLRALRHRLVAAGIWIVVVPSLGFGLLGVLGSLRLSDLGASAVAIGAVWILASAAEGAISPVVGRVADRRGPLWLARYGLGVATVLTLLVPAASAAWLLGLLIVALAPAYGTLWVPGIALISDGVEASGLDQGFAFAIFNMFWAGAQIAGSAGGASLAQATSDVVPYGLVAVLSLGTLVAIQARRTVPA
jgi:MFS family permease